MLSLKKGKLTQMEILAELANQIYVTCQDCHPGRKLMGKSLNKVSHSGGRLNVFIEISLKFLIGPTTMSA